MANKTISKNKSLETVAKIEELIQQDAADWCMDDQEDRANMAWWNYRNFIKGDYMEPNKIQVSRGPGGGGGIQVDRPAGGGGNFRGPLPGKEEIA